MIEQTTKKNSKTKNFKEFEDILSRTLASYFLSSRIDNINNNIINHMIFIATIFVSFSMGIIINYISGSLKPNLEGFIVFIFLLMILVIICLYYILKVYQPLIEEKTKLIKAREKINNEINRFEDLSPKEEIVKGKIY